MEQRRRRNQQVQSPPEAANQLQPEQGQKPEQEEKIKLYYYRKLPSGGRMIVRDGFRHE